ncbi:MAG: hypothetical protein C5B58_06655 [Acidobacteria bacterium]|nr:MAG: hypothetical protein C5B58_06655 [Acidobacteriota bacterium]
MKRAVGQKSRAVIATELLLLILLAGCSVPAVTNVTPERLMSGQSSTVVGTQFATGNEPVAIAMTRTGTNLYTANLMDGTVSAFKAGSSAAIEAVNGSPFEAGLHPVALCITNDGRFLYVANTGGQTVWGFSISDGGALIPAGSPTHAGFSPLGVAADATGNFLYVVSGADNSLSEFRINRSDGTLSVIAGSPLTAGSAPVAILANPHGEYVHVLSAVNSTLTTYRIDSEGGQLTQTGQSQTGFQPSALAISLTGGFIYTTNAGDGSISEFAFDQRNGTTRALAGSPIRTGMNPLGIAIDPEDRFAYVANFNSNEIWGYSVAADGTLHPLEGPKTLAAPRPKAITVAPNQKVLYVTNVETNVVTGYAIGNDGTLQPLLR